MGISEGLAAISIKYPDRLFIGGAWVAPSSGERIKVVSPMSEEVVFSVAEAREADMDRAVAAAREAFDVGPWPRMSPAERAAYLRKFGDALAARGAELAHAWTNQVGVLHSFAQYAGYLAKGSFDQYAGMAQTFAFEEPHTPSNGGGKATLVREPVGVVAAIVPWNAPLSAACVKIAPALIAGCAVILKPSPETPVDAYLMAEVAEKIGLPAGVFNVVVGHREASEHLIRNPHVDKVSFTGSSAAGMRIASLLGGRMARYTMELGGKSAAIVLDDVAPADVVAKLAGGICAMSGQVCAALSRVIVPRARHDEYADAFAAALNAMRTGDPYDPAAQLGPLAMARQLERVKSYIAKGRAEGARVAAGGARPAGFNRGYYIEPTLFTNVDNRMTIAREEIFGPVLSLIPAANEEDAIRIANDSPYGLNGAVFTPDPARAYEVARRMRTGNIAQNGFRMDMSIAFGGFKQSGVGREGGREGLLPFLEAKTLFLDSAG
jgi:aldehyde dehydrogenase (NAD+)